MTSGCPDLVERCSGELSLPQMWILLVVGPKRKVTQEVHLQFNVPVFKIEKSP